MARNKSKNTEQAPATENQAPEGVELDREGFRMHSWTFPNEPFKGLAVRHRALGPAAFQSEDGLIRQLRVLAGGSADEPLTGENLRAAAGAVDTGTRLGIQKPIKSDVAARVADEEAGDPTPEDVQQIAAEATLQEKRRGGVRSAQKAAEKAAVATAKELAADEDFLSKLTPEQRAKFAMLSGS